MQTMIVNIVHQNETGGLPDVLFPTEGAEPSENETTLAFGEVL